MSAYRFYICAVIVNNEIDFMNFPLRPKHKVEVDVLTESDEQCDLVVWNDEVNTFEHVIETLIEVCGHTPEQAAQCTLFIHFNGSYAVKHGSYNELKPMCEQIIDRGIGATIEFNT